MEELFVQFSQFTEQNVALAYGLLFLAAMVENLFPPIPGDTVTLFGAVFVGSGALSFSGVLISTTLGSVAGFMILFIIAYKLQWALFERRQIPWLDPAKLARVEGWFQKYGYGIILGNRFLSGVRSVISISAGLSRLSIGRTTLYATASALVWNAMIIYAGSLVGQNWQQIQGYLDIYGRVIFFVLLSIAAIYLGWRTFKRRNADS